MPGKSTGLSDAITGLSEPAQSKVKVQLSHELVHLLSEQLYQSPLKAIEELVVNSYDASAKVCRAYVPRSAQVSTAKSDECVAVFDDGEGLSEEGMSSQTDRKIRDRKARHLYRLQPAYVCVEDFAGDFDDVARLF
jgi:hypothetical protein